MNVINEALNLMMSEMDVTGGHDAAHIERVRANAKNIAAKEGGNLLAIDLACILHDLVNPPKSSPLRRQASTLSADKAAAWLEGRVLDCVIEKVHDAVKSHSYSAGFVPQTIEGQIVSDADNLDAMGAVGIIRTFECGGSMGRQSMYPTDPFCKERLPDDSTNTLDHFYKKLLLLESRMYTREGKRLARRRVQFMELFLEELEHELG